MIGIENWFSTQIATIDASEVLSCARRKFDAVDFSKYSKDEYKHGQTTYFDDAAEYAKDPDLAELHYLVCNSVEVFAQQQGVDIKRLQCCVTEMWLNRMMADASHAKHVHGSSHYSGTLYVNSPEGAGPIRFHSPLDALWKFCPLPVADEGNPYTCSYVTHEPTPGKMLAWNSWLDHEVLPGSFSGFRDSISFNVRLEKRRTF